MSDTCGVGLQGFPIQVTGFQNLSRDERIRMITPNDISIQFSPSEAPMNQNRSNGFFNLNGNSTFFLNGTQWNVRAARLCQPRQNGLTEFSGNPLGEFQIWATPTASTIPKADIAVLIVPVRQYQETSTAGTTLIAAIQGESIRLEGFLPTGKNIQIIKQSTCIETSTPLAKTIAVAYWSQGAAINPEQVRTLGNLPVSGIPDIFGYRFLTNQVQQTDANRTKGSREFKDTNGVLQPQTQVTPLATQTPEFQQSFRIINGFVIEDTRRKDADKQKCIRVDRTRDIKNGNLVVDPKTGRRLQEEMDEAAKQEAETLEMPEASASRDTWLWVCTIVGALIGFGLLAGLIVFLFTWFVNRKGQGLPPLDEATQKLVTNLPKNITGA